MPTDDDTREFRIATLRQLVAAEGKPAPATAGDPDRYRVLFFGAAGTSAILAVTLLLMLLTGSGSKARNTGSAATVATTPGFVTITLQLLDTRLPNGVSPKSVVTFTLVDQSPVATNVKVLDVRRPKASVTTLYASVDVNVSNDDAKKLRAVAPKDLYLTVGAVPAAPATTAPPPATTGSTQPPAAPAPATPPSS